MAVTKVKKPAWGFDYNYNYSGYYTNVGNASRYYPSYSYMNMNSNINKALNPAFVQNAKAGLCGQGISLYGYLNSDVVDSSVGNYMQWKEATHAWSMAIPSSIGVPVGLFSMNVNGGIYVAEGIIGPSANYNLCLYVDTDLYLKCGTMYRGTSMPPVEIYNYGLNMAPYTYAPDYPNTGVYIGHRYGMHYNLESEAYDFYADSVATKIASINKDLIMQGLIIMFGGGAYNDYYEEFGGVFNNYYYIGPGAYAYNSATGYNVYQQGNVYYSDWVGWETSVNLQTLSGIMNFDYKEIPIPKSYSYNGALVNCNQLRTIIFPGSMDNIPSGILSGNNLTSVAFRNGVNNISQDAIKSSGSRRLEVEIPQTVKQISWNAINASVVSLQSPISYNAYIRHQMLSGYNSEYPFEFYESVERLQVENIPSKQFKPAAYYKHETRNGISNMPYNSPSRLGLVYNQAEITTTDSDTLVFDWHNANIQVIFNQPVNIMAHSNAVGFQPYDMTEEGFVADIYSREFPDFSVSQRFTFINDQNFILEADQLTAGPYNVRVLGHITGNFVTIPAVFDDAYVTSTINFTASGYNAGPAYVDIEVPKRPADIAAYNTILTVTRLPAGTTDVQLRDGDITYFTDAVSRVNCSISNVNDVYLASNGISELLVAGSYNLYGLPPASLHIAVIANNFITVGGSFNNSDLSASNLNFSFWRTQKPVYVNTLLHDDAQLFTFLGYDDVGMFCNNYYDTIQKQARDAYQVYLNAINDSVNPGPLQVHNCALPPSIAIRNIWHAAGSFNSCHGDINVAMYGYIMPIGQATNYMFNNHTGTINFDASLARIPLGTRNSAGVNASPLHLARNCNIGILRVNFTDTYNTTNAKLFLETRTNMYAVELFDCNIDTLVIDSPNTYYQLRNCNINHIVYTGIPLKRLYLAGCNVYDSLQPIFDNAADSDLYLYQTNLYADSSITIHRGQNAHMTSMWSPYGSGIPSMLMINGPDTATVIDDTQLAAETASVIINATHINYKGRFAPVFQTTNSRLQTAHVECTELSASAFNNCRHLTTVTGLENCLYIGPSAFENCVSLTSITVHPNCSIHKDAFKNAPQVAIYYGNGSKYPVDLNVTYLVARTTAAPANWGSLKDRLGVNIIFNDGTEEPTTDFYITPDFPAAYNAAYSNTYHIVRANGVHKRILSPYNRTNMTGVNNTYNTVRTPWTTANYAVSGYTGMYYDVKNDHGGFAHINCTPSEVSVSSGYKNELYYVYSLNAIHSLVISGNYNAWYPALWSGTGSIPGAVLNVIATNTAVKNGSTILWANHCSRRFEYIRDDCAYMTASWTSSGNNRTQHQGIQIHTLDLQRSNYSTYALGNNMIRDCTIYELLLPNSARMNMIANNAVFNCNTLYWVDMNMLTNANFRINDNAFVNCYSLCRLRLPQGTDFVGNGAFNRTGLKYVEAPTKCRMGTNAFPADCVITYY